MIGSTKSEYIREDYNQRSSLFKNIQRSYNLKKTLPNIDQVIKTKTSRSTGTNKNHITIEKFNNQKENENPPKKKK